MVRWLKNIVGDGDAEEDELLGPNCQVLVSAYDFEAGALLSLEIDMAAARVELRMDLPVLEGHPAYSALREVRRLVTASFHGVIEPSATLRGESIPRGRPFELEYEHVIDEFYISATSPWAYRETAFHAHVLWLLAEGLVLAFPFADVRCKETIEDE
jgi:hypothetical protein